MYQYCIVEPIFLTFYYTTVNMHQNIVNQLKFKINTALNCN